MRTFINNQCSSEEMRDDIQTYPIKVKGLMTMICGVKDKLFMITGKIYV